MEVRGLGLRGYGKVLWCCGVRHMSSELEDGLKSRGKRA